MANAQCTLFFGETRRLRPDEKAWRDVLAGRYVR